MATERSGASAGLVALQLVLEEEHYRAMPAEDLLGRYLSERDERAFAALVHRYGRLVMARCREILRHEDLAQEAFQEAFTQLVINGHTVRRRGAVGHWLARSARRRSLNIARREKRQRARDLAYVPAASPADPGTAANEADVRVAVARAMSTLPEHYRLPIELVYLDGMTHAEAAKAIGCSKGTVDSYVRRALERLNRVLTPSGLLMGGAAVLIPPAEAVPPDWVQGVIVRATSISAREPSPLTLLWDRLTSPPAIATAAVVGVVSVGIIVALVQKRKTPDPPATTPPVTASVEPPPVPEPSPDDVVLGQVLSIMDKLTGMKTERKMVIQEGPRHVRWRFIWVPDPSHQGERRSVWSAFISEKSFVDLVFDRWSGKLDMELALDGKKVENVDPRRPFIIGPFAIKIPELVEIHQAYPRMLMKTIPSTNRTGPLCPERVYFDIVASATDTDFARPEPDQGVAIRLEPGATLVAKRRPGPEGRRTVILFWRTGESSEIKNFFHGDSDWTYRNESNEGQDIFIAAVCGKTEKWMTCQPRMTKQADGMRIIDFDEDYEGAFDDARLEVRVSQPKSDR